MGQVYGAEDEILAKVGNEVITRSDFEARLKSFPPAVQAGLNDLEKRKQLLDNMIKGRLLVVEGASRGLTEKEEVKARLRMMRDDFITQEYVRAYVENNVEVSDEEAQNNYNTNPEIREREYLKISQIVVEREEEAKAILEKLKNKEPFKKLVKENSIDPESKNRGGELEWFEKGTKEKEIEEALLKLDKDEISDVVKAKGKYYVLKLDERNIVPKVPYLKVKDQIIRGLRIKKATGLVEQEIEELKKKTPVETFYDRLIPKAK